MCISTKKMHARYWTGFIHGINVPTEKTDEIEQLDVHTKIKRNDQSDHEINRLSTNENREKVNLLKMVIYSHDFMS